MKPYFQRGGLTIYHGDLRDVLPKLESADCIIADPTYGETSLSWDRRIPEWPALALARCLPHASMWCFGSLRSFRETVADFAGWKHSQDIVWEKHNGSNFANDRFRRVHELAAQFYPSSAKWEDIYKKPVTTNDAVKRTLRRKHRPTHTGDIGACAYASEDGGPRLMRSVIYARSCHGKATNETQKPTAIVAPLVEYSCRPGGLVIDPFMGSGTTLDVCRAMGLSAIGIDIREDQCEDAARRLSQQVFEF